MTRTQLINNQIDEIMDTFDFAKVGRVMRFLNWKWNGSDDYLYEPEIRSHARNLMKNLVDFNESGYTSTGGFMARLTQGIDNAGKWLRVDLEFVVDQSLLDGEYYS